MSANNWTTVKTKAKDTVVKGAYVPPSQRKAEKAPEQTFDEMFPEGLLPVATVKKTAWASDFKAAIEKKTPDAPIVDNSILFSYTNPRTGRTTVVKDMPFHPDDRAGIEEANMMVPNISSIMKKVSARRRALDDEEDSLFQAEEESQVEEENYDNFSEEDLEETTADDYVSD